MPIYEYRCLDCDHEFERMQKFSDAPLTECPSCAGRVQKLISRSAFHLKGDGWYVTDYARKSGANGTTTNSNDSTDKQDKSKESSTDSKTENKAESKTDSSSSSSQTATAST